MKKTNLLFFTCLAFLVVILFSSCDILGDDSSESSSAQVRMYASYNVSGVYVTVGTIDSYGYYTAATDWHYASYGNYSSYSSVSPGTYKLIFDYDSYHSDATYFNDDMILEAGGSYTCIVTYDDSMDVYTFTPVED